MSHTTLRHLPAAERGQHWTERAACKGVSVNVFFPKRKTDAHPALAFCSVCPVFDDCQADVAAARANGIRVTGVWAGDLWVNGTRIPGNEVGRRAPAKTKTEIGRRREEAHLMQATAIALYHESRPMYSSNTSCQVAVATKLGIHKQTIAKWLRTENAKERQSALPDPLSLQMASGDPDESLDA